jgi:hypothetical protein
MDQAQTIVIKKCHQKYLHSLYVGVLRQAAGRHNGHSTDKVLSALENLWQHARCCFSYGMTTACRRTHLEKALKRVQSCFTNFDPHFTGLLWILGHETLRYHPHPEEVCVKSIYNTLLATCDWLVEPTEGHWSFAHLPGGARKQLGGIFSSWWKVLKFSWPHLTNSQRAELESHYLKMVEDAKGKLSSKDEQVLTDSVDWINYQMGRIKKARPIIF